uniref:Uncharacterized protein n=1 Tax=Panagrolaimus sp. JU765 TaxID=591449 RepID=A0AC34QRH3_9BILA
MGSEGSFYLSRENKLGWNYNKNYRIDIPQSTDGRIPKISVSFLPLFHDFFNWKIENVSDFIKKIFVSTKDFVQLFMDRRQFVFDFMDFLIKNHGTNNMILTLNSRSTLTIDGTRYESHHRSKILAAFEEKYADLFKTFKYYRGPHMNDEQGQVPCSTIIFSNSGKIEIKDLLMKEIDLYHTTETDYDKCLRYSDVEDATKDARFDILAEQIFQLYWLKKLVKNEINYFTFRKNSKLPALTSEDIQKKCRKLMVYNEKINKIWDETISRCSEILEGSTKTESDLFAELPLHYFTVLRKEFVTASAFQAGDVSNNEQISKLKMLVDESEEIEDVEDSEKTTPGSNESQKTSSSGSATLCSESTITMNNKDYRSLQSEMTQLLKMTILLSNKALQPFVKTQDSNERILLGFGSHRNRTKPKTTEKSDMFISPCPLECTIDDRQWICINCGEFFKADGFQVVCSCGRTHVSNLKFECFDPKHPKDFFPCEKPDPTSASISSSRRSSFSVVEDAQ